jgi:quinol-cytochrome oxidoreductase complex cytochrome b subunit
MARLEGAYEQVSQRLMNIDPRFDGVDRKIDLRFDALDKKIDALEAKIDAKADQRFMWTIGFVLTTWLTSMGTTIYLRH